MNIPKKFHYFYKITNNLTGEYYLGIHSTDNLEDGYFGSGTKLWEKIGEFGKEHFSKEILRYFDSREEASLYESKTITATVLQDPKCYNLRTGGDVVRLPGGHTSVEAQEKRRRTVEERKKDPEYQKQISIKISQAIKGKPKPQGFGEKISKARTGVPRPELQGVPKSEEHRRKIGEALRGRHLSKEHIEHLCHPKYNSTYIKTEEHLKKISEALKGHEVSEERKKAISNARKGKIWVIKDGRKKLISKEESEKFLTLGYTKFRKEWKEKEISCL